jgi:hypothetical protein
VENETFRPNRPVFLPRSVGTPEFLERHNFYELRLWKDRRAECHAWEALVRKVYAMSLKGNASAARLLGEIRKRLAGRLLPDDPVVYVTCE